MSIPSLLGGLLFTAMPESPKFLMSRGRNEEALDVFQEIYRRNHNSSEFPIKALANEKYVPTSHSTTTDESRNEAQQQPGANENDDKSSLWMVVRAGLVQMLIIFEGPYLRNCILVFVMQFGFLWSQNTMRLWLPSILGMIEDYQEAYVGITGGSTSFDLCRVIESSVSSDVLALSPGNATEVAVCSQVPFLETSDNFSYHSLTYYLLACQQVVDGSIYLNTMSVGVVGLVGYAIAGTIITALGHRNMICKDAYLWL